jgi:hypothetical protein
MLSRSLLLSNLVKSFLLVGPVLFGLCFVSLRLLQLMLFALRGCFRQLLLLRLCSRRRRCLDTLHLTVQNFPSVRGTFPLAFVHQLHWCYPPWKTVGERPPSAHDRARPDARPKLGWQPRLDGEHGPKGNKLCPRLVGSLPCPPSWCMAGSGHPVMMALVHDWRHMYGSLVWWMYGGC